MSKTIQNNNFIHTTIDRTPYTYLIGWKALDKWYYGVRYGKGVHPSDLWVTYFTSSKHVKKFRELHGEPDIIEIRKTFDSIDSARNWEDKVIDRMNMVYSERFLNLAHSKAIHPDATHNFRRGKTFDVLYGVERAKQLKKDISDRNISSKGTLKPWAERHPDIDHPHKGKTFSDERRKQMSIKSLAFYHDDDDEIAQRHESYISANEKRKAKSDQFTNLWQDLEFQIKFSEFKIQLPTES